MALSERYSLPERKPSAMRAESGIHPTFRVAPPPQAEVVQLRRRANDAVDHAVHAYDAPANDNDEVVELSSEDLEEVSPEAVPGTDPKVEEERLAQEAQYLMDEINARIIALNQLDHDLAQAHEHRLALTPHQQENLLTRGLVQQMDKDISAMDRERIGYEEMIPLLEGKLRKNIDARQAVKHREAPAARKSERVLDVRESYRQVDQLSAAVTEINQQITQEGVASTALANNLSMAMARAQAIKEDMNRINGLLLKERGVFSRIFGSSKKTSLEAQLRDQQAAAEVADGAYRQAFEAIAAHNRVIDDLYHQSDVMTARIRDIHQTLSEDLAA